MAAGVFGRPLSASGREWTRVTVKSKTGTAAGGSVSGGTACWAKIEGMGATAQLVAQGLGQGQARYRAWFRAGVTVVVTDIIEWIYHGTTYKLVVESVLPDPPDHIVCECSVSG